MKIKLGKFLPKNLAALKTISVYTASSALNSIIIFVSLGFYLKHLPPDEYGRAVFYSLLVSLLAPLISLNANAYFWTIYFDNKHHKKNIYSSTYFFNLGTVLFFTIVVILIPFQAIIPVNLNGFIYLVPITVFLTILNDDLRNLLIYEKNLSAYIWVNNGLCLLENILIILLVKYYSASYTSRICAWIITLSIVFFLHAYFFVKKKKYLGITISFQTLSTSTRFGFPLMFQQWSKMALSVSDRWFLAGIVNVSQMGIYNLGYQIGSIISTFISGYINFLTPLLYKSLSDQDEVRFKRITRMFFIFLALLSFAVVAIYTIFLLLAKPVLGQQYYFAAPYILFAGFATIIYAFSIPYSSLITYGRRTDMMAIISVAVLIINLVLNYFLISRYKTMGAAYSTILSYLLYAILIKMTYNRFRKARQIHVV